MTAIVLTTYIAVIVIFLVISYRCLGGRESSFLANLTLSVIVSAIISSLGISIWLSLDDNAWMTENYKQRTRDIDSVKVDKGILVLYGTGIGKGTKGSEVYKSEGDKSYVEIWAEQKNAGESMLYGDITLDTRTPQKRKIYLNKKDYEIWETSKSNSKE